MSLLSIYCRAPQPLHTPAASPIFHPILPPQFLHLQIIIHHPPSDRKKKSETIILRGSGRHRYGRPAPAKPAKILSNSDVCVRPAGINLRISISFTALFDTAFPHTTNVSRTFQCLIQSISAEETSHLPIRRLLSQSPVSLGSGLSFPGICTISLSGYFLCSFFPPAAFLRQIALNIRISGSYLPEASSYKSIIT
jgi:hypothetical protein